ncbi:MAG: hypothetical protein JO051_07415 [Acidobacteriaceae bacterium]|nr:hypothetical protein [Acidobacteriaceae bacterium]
MGSYLQEYGAGEEQRNRIIKWTIVCCIAAAVVAFAAYLIFHDYAEQRVAKHFLADVNGRNYQGAYRDWGCATEHPCPNYDYTRFMQDWGPSSKVTAPWRVQSTDSCKAFVTINVQAPGSELQSLAVQRDNHSLSFAPAPECQERRWRWKQFFSKILHPTSSS